MKKLLLILITVILIGCSKEDDENCLEITFVGERTIWYQARFHTFDVISGYYHNNPKDTLDISLPDLDNIKVGDIICN